MLGEVEKIYIYQITNLYQVAKKLIRFIEYVCNYTPESHEFSRRFLSEIDKQLDKGQPPWRERIKKYSTDGVIDEKRV